MLRKAAPFILPTPLMLGCPMPASKMQQEVTVRIRAKPSENTAAAQMALEAYGGVAEVLKLGLASHEEPSNILVGVLGAVQHALSYSYTSEGSGFLIRASETDDLLAVTNKHVVGSAPKVDVILNKHLTIHDCNVRYVDGNFDVAFIAIPDIDALDVMTAYLANEDPDTPVPVTAVGFPTINGGQYLMTSGSISNTRRQRDDTDHPTDWYLQHTATIEQGNSGGPLFWDDTLKVIGINTFREPTKGLYGAIPASQVLTSLKTALTRPASGIKGAESVLVESCERLVNDLKAERESPHTETLDLISEAFALTVLAANAYKDVEFLLSRIQAQMDPKKGGSTRRAPWKPDAMVPSPRAWTNTPVTSELVGNDNSALGFELSSTGGIDLRTYQAKLLTYKSFEALFKNHGVIDEGLCKRYNTSDMDKYEDNHQVKISLSFKGSHNPHLHTLSWRFEQGHWRVISFE